VGKDIHLTRRNWLDDTIEEDCTLLDDEEPLFIVTSENPVIATSTDSTVGNFAGGRVMFEDDHGIFGVDPKEIVNIEPLEA
jgi:hypothetical protein